MRITCLHYAELGLICLAFGLAAMGNPMLDMPLDEGRGDTVRDKRTSNVSKVHTAQWVQSEHGRVLNFDGEHSYIACEDAKGLLLPDQLTLTAWIK